MYFFALSRYSHVMRPNEISIDRSSPTNRKQIRGEFQTEEERISNLFATSSPAKK
jgi:hypothetical protein